MSMNKKEKYYDYIINDLVDTTYIKEEDDKYWSEVEFPFDKGNMYGIRYLTNLKNPGNMGKTFFKLFIKFAHYIVNVYGVKPEEFSMIWNRYLDEIDDKWGINIQRLPN